MGNNNFINDLNQELVSLSDQSHKVPTEIGILKIKSANQTMLDASKLKNPEPLWYEFWYEGEVCCLFADSNLGKSIYAVQIATNIAKSRRVIYADFELSDKQFQLRYTDEQTQEMFQFPENLYRLEIDPEKYDATTFEDSIINNLENVIVRTNAKVIIIDNLTYLSSATEKGDAAGILMMNLMNLKRKYRLSILVLAHTPKRQLTNPITQNDLAGSKKLYNYFDSVFAIGKSFRDPQLRYIKQIKVRYGEFKYDTDNVIVCIIKKINAFLQFFMIDFAEERDHLKTLDDNQREELISKAKAMNMEGKSNREIAEQLGIGKSSVNRYIHS